MVLYFPLSDLNIPYCRLYEIVTFFGRPYSTRSFVLNSYVPWQLWSWSSSWRPWRSSYSSLIRRFALFAALAAHPPSSNLPSGRGGHPPSSNLPGGRGGHPPSSNLPCGRGGHPPLTIFLAAVAVIRPWQPSWRPWRSSALNNLPGGHPAPRRNAGLRHSPH